MTVKILAFAQARETFGFPERTVECDPGQTPREVMASVAPGISLESLRVAVDSEYVDWDKPLGEAGEMALLPPVSGG